jgi:hypothetical protein
VSAPTHSGMIPLTVERRIELVKAAIGRVESANRQWQEACADAGSSANHRDTLKERIQFAEREFGWQWQNVRAILEHYQKG